MTPVPAACAPSEDTPITYRELETTYRMLGRLVSWPNLLTLLEECHSVHVVFSLERNGDSSARSMSVTKDQMRQVALEGIRWAHQSGQRQRVRVNSAGRTLYVGARV